MVVHRLITLFICLFIRTVDVRWQRHVTNLIENIQYHGFRSKTDFKQRIVTRLHHGMKLIVLA
ncbi:Uncharacterised protein [Vibrio cholerae]|uniref:Uncharacterized protein n=1 Tax=Vibrio cholerae TaxID=666 RepID=A0A655R1L6_VIBCL|nr:Uncharacterised protein [Vibrio cholerae]